MKNGEQMKAEEVKECLNNLYTLADFTDVHGNSIDKSKYREGER